MKKPIGIVVATRFEARPLIKALGLQSLEKNLFSGRVSEHDVLLIVSGVGKLSARRASDVLCHKGVSMLISAGFCGALVPDLRVADLVTHRLITVDVPARNFAERQTIAERTSPVAVDMETQAIIEAGTLAGVPIYTLRVVSDEWKDDLTPLLGTDQNFVPWKIALRLLNPMVWPLARQLKRNSDRASQRLIAEVRAFLQNPLAH